MLCRVQCFNPVQCSDNSECPLCNLPWCFVLLSCHTEYLLERRLSAPLTPAKRSRDRRLDGASQGGSTLASPSQRLKTETTGATSQSGAAAAAKAAAGPMPGDDLPPVLAPPGRSAVMHVPLPAWQSTHLPSTCNMDIVQVTLRQHLSMGCSLYKHSSECHKL